MTPGSRTALPSLTGLRFWAALLVVTYHLSRQVGEVPGVSSLVWYGRSGVTFFFVLSGFVLAWTYDGARVPARTFYWRRFARIWPLHVLTTVLSVAVYWCMSRPVDPVSVVASLPLVHAWHPALAKGGNPAAWSLSDEAFFYALLPVVLPLMRRVAGRAAPYVLASAAVWPAGALIADPTVRGWALDYLPLARTPQFLLGVAVGLAVRRGWRTPVPLPYAVAAVLAWHAALIPWHHAAPDDAWYGPYQASQLLAAPLFALLIAAAADRDTTAGTAVLGARWCVRLGQWSFAWYLVHEVVLRTYVYAYGKPSDGPAVLLAWLVIGAGSQLAAGLLHAAVERPAERWLRRREPDVPSAARATAAVVPPPNGGPVPGGRAAARAARAASDRGGR